MGRFCAEWGPIAGRERGVVWIVAGVALLLIAGLAAIARRKLKLLLATAALAAALLAAELVTVILLPSHCSPDDPSRPGCSHY
jgi:hypothetical protein